jgi:hypothetical protein
MTAKIQSHNFGGLEWLGRHESKSIWWLKFSHEINKYPNYYDMEKFRF